MRLNAGKGFRSRVTTDKSRDLQEKWISFEIKNTFFSDCKNSDFSRFFLVLLCIIMVVGQIGQIKGGGLVGTATLGTRTNGFRCIQCVVIGAQIRRY